MDIANITQEAFDKYYSILRKRGYVDSKITKVVLLLAAINKMLSGDMKYFMTNSEYRIIYKAISCLYSKEPCLIDSPLSLNGNFLYITKCLPCLNSK